jgi:hypothetical protein
VTGFDWDGLYLNVLANFVSTAIIAAAVVVLLVLMRRRGMRRFFGFRPGRQKLVIYLSSIAVEPGGTRGTGALKEGFHGNAITELEYRSALELADTIRSGVTSRLLHALVGARSNSEAVAAHVVQSPSFRHLSRDPDGEVQPEWSVADQLGTPSSIVLVGGPIYNVLTDQLLKLRRQTDTVPRFEFLRYTTPEGRPVRGIRAYIAGRPEDYERQELDEHVVDYFVIEKIQLGDTIVFLCAGTCTAATAAAVRKLEDWRRWAKEYGGGRFGRLYEISLPTATGVSSSDARERTISPSDPVFKRGYSENDCVDRPHG